jgi:ribosomal protein S18 acetylase RimI-like enzyme
VIDLWQKCGLEIGHSDTKESLRQQLQRDEDLFIIAEEDNRIVGAVLGRWDGRRGWLNHLAVAPDYRHQRLGSLLVAQLEERLKAKGCEKLNLFIAASNSGVQGFYQFLGYTRDELIFMEKWLK